MYRAEATATSAAEVGKVLEIHVLFIPNLDLFCLNTGDEV
jgi:hypothetical protein